MKTIKVYKCPSIKKRHDIVLRIGNEKRHIVDDFITVQVDNGDTLSVSQQWCKSKKYNYDYFDDGGQYMIFTMFSISFMFAYAGFSVANIILYHYCFHNILILAPCFIASTIVLLGFTVFSGRYFRIKRWE